MDIRAQLVRFGIDPKSTELDLTYDEFLMDKDCEFSRIDDRFAMTHYRHAFFDIMNSAHGTDFPSIGTVMGGGFPPPITVEYFPGPKHLVQEVVLIPRSANAREGVGCLLFLVNNYETMSSELHIVDTTNFSQAQVIVYLPLRLRPGLHGTWVDSQEIFPAA